MTIQQFQRAEMILARINELEKELKDWQGMDDSKPLLVGAGTACRVSFSWGQIDRIKEIEVSGINSEISNLRKEFEML
jgi:hypothetical protein